MKTNNKINDAMAQTHSRNNGTHRTHFTHLITFPKAAFTLAEVLITLAIIGIVAAITIPSIVNTYKEKQTVTALKKNYSVLNNAFNLAIAEYGDISQWNSKEVIMSYEQNGDEKVPVIETVMDIEDRLIKFLNIAVDCGYEAKGCFDNTYKKLSGENERDFENLPRYRKLFLNDGSLIAIQGYLLVDKYVGELWLDVNGKKGPNTTGKDLFLFGITTRGLTPYNQEFVVSQPLSNTSCKIDSDGYNCSNWVLQYENLDYLRCNDLEWGKKTKCD